MERTAKIQRETLETRISGEICLDGEGKGVVKTGIPFLDHMLVQVAKHGFFDLTIQAEGDIEVDYHHTIEDVGIVLGLLLDKALGDKSGIIRYGYASVPMDESLSSVNIDISARPLLVYNVSIDAFIRDIDPALFEDFFRAVTNQSRMTLHINLLYGRDPHHAVESIFKAFGKSLHQATRKAAGIKGHLSTKGIIV